MSRKRNRSQRVLPAPPPWVGSWLRSHRIAQGLRLRDIAVRLDCDESRISRIECGETRFVADDLPRVLAAYDLTASQFEARAIELKAA